MRIPTKQFQLELEQVLGYFENRLPFPPFNDIRELVSAGEPGVAFEIICTQAFEFDVSVDKHIWEMLDRTGTAMGISPEYWMPLTICTPDPTIGRDPTTE